MCLLVRVSGTVQGVGYRAFARSAARELEIRGHAHNLPDGSVEVLACGSEAALQDLLARLRTGPRWSQVTNVVTERVDCTEPADFRTG